MEYRMRSSHAHWEIQGENREMSRGIRKEIMIENIPKLKATSPSLKGHTNS